MPLSIQVKVTVPKIMFKDKKWEKNVTDIMKKKTAPEVKELFRGTTYGWSEHPSFKQHLGRWASKLSMEIYTEDDIYALLTLGSPRHPIPAKPGGILRFRPGYRSATRAGSLISNRAYRSGPYVTAKIIPDHPGFTAREFPLLIAKKYAPTFARDIQGAIIQAAINP